MYHYETGFNGLYIAITNNGRDVAFLQDGDAAEFLDTVREIEEYNVTDEQCEAMVQGIMSAYDTGGQE